MLFWMVTAALLVSVHDVLVPTTLYVPLALTMICALVAPLDHR